MERSPDNVAHTRPETWKPVSCLNNVQVLLSFCTFPILQTSNFDPSENRGAELEVTAFCKLSKAKCDKNSSGVPDVWVVDYATLDMCPIFLEYNTSNIIYNIYIILFSHVEPLSI